jgi:hypothetical protein
LRPTKGKECIEKSILLVAEKKLSTTKMEFTTKKPFERKSWNSPHKKPFERKRWNSPQTLATIRKCIFSVCMDVIVIIVIIIVVLKMKFSATVCIHT